MKKSCLLFLVSCLLCSVSYGVVLLDDTWADGSLSETDLPNESAVWVSHLDGVTMGTGSLAFDQTASSGSQKLWTYFTADGAPASIGVGQQLLTTIQFAPSGGLYDNSSRSFRFGLFHDPTDAQVHTHTNDDGGGTGDPWTDSTGYGVQIALSNGDTTATAMNVGKRTDQANNSLMGSSGAWTMTNSGNDVIVALDTVYTLTLLLDRVAADQMQVTCTLSDAGGIISTHSILDDPTGTGEFGTDAIATDFDHLFFRFSNNTSTADIIDFREFKVELIPEPATMLLLGLGGLISLRKRR